jgi:hypothetical protein
VQTLIAHKRIAIVLASWLGLAVIASSLQVFKAGSGLGLVSPLPLGLAVLLPVAIFGAAYLSSAKFRQWIYGLDPRTLTIAQSWRMAGVVFIVLYAVGMLPGVFALPAGWGDILVGITAPFAAFYFAVQRRRNGFLAWQYLGIADLALAVTLGVLASPSPVGFLAGSITTGPMTYLPLSLVPTFVVPLLLIVHIICILQARRWPAVARVAFARGR